MGYFQPMVIYRDPDEKRENSIIRYIGNRVLRNNKNFLCALVGQTGAGKSWAGLKIGEEYSKMFNLEFNPEIHVISSLKELLILITEKNLEQKIKYGTFILFDEPQVESNARNWQSEMNQALSQLISTFRNQRLVVFFATPYLEFIDKQSRILFHGEFKVLGFDKNTQITKIKPRFLEYNKKTNDFYRKRLIIQHAIKDKPVMNIKKLGFWHIGKPSESTIEVYEKKKKEFTDALNKKLLNQIELSEKQSEGKNKSEEIFKIKELYEKYGENYILILEKMPHLNPFTIEKYIQFIKKSKKSKMFSEDVQKIAQKTTPLEPLKA
jgi:hypothetical protein